MVKVSTPELKKYVGRKVMVNINGNRKVIGILNGYDIYLNIVIHNGLEVLEPNNTTTKPNPDENGVMGQETVALGKETIIRGNSIVSLEALETI